MAINYEKVKWNETPYKYANPENMNKMDNGIKSACDGIDSIAADYSKKCEMDELKYLGWVTPREYTGTRSSTDSNGKFNQMVGRVDLGTLSWSGSSSFQSSDLVGKAKAVATSVMPNMYSGGITVVKADNFSSADTAICIDADGRLLAKKSGVSDATAFRSAMSGVYLYYQLQTPVEWTEGSEQIVENTTDIASLMTQVNELIKGYDGAGYHNGVYRGKSLGTSVTSAQYSEISSGRFRDLYIGDYWTIDGVNYRIAGFDYYYRCGDSDLTTHHAVIVPDTCFYNHVMNDTNVTTGGYVGSKMYTEGLESAKSTIKTAFSGHVLKHRVYLTNATSNGKASAGAWRDSEVDLMCEQMVYGTGIFSPVSDGSNVPANYRVEKSQLPLFAHEPSRIVTRNNYWLRDVVTAAYFALVSTDGYATCIYAGNSRGVRPSFCIKG